MFRYSTTYRSLQFLYSKRFTCFAAQGELDSSHDDLCHSTMATYDGDPRESEETISRIISNLKSAFLVSDFARAQVFLLSREEKLKREIAAQEKEIDLLRADRFIMEAELKGCRIECGKLKEERDEFREKIKKDKRVIEELQTQICDLECANRKANTEVERYKTKFKELEVRVLFLENEVSGWGVEGQRANASAGRVSDCGEDGEKVRCEGEAIDCRNRGPCFQLPEARAGVLGNVAGNSNSKVFAESEKVGCLGQSFEKVGAAEHVDVCDTTDGRASDSEGFRENGASAGFQKNAGNSARGEGAGTKLCDNRCSELKQFPHSQSTATGNANNGLSGTGIHVIGGIVDIEDTDDNSGSCESLEVEEKSTQVLVDDALSGQEPGEMESVANKRKHATFSNAQRNDRDDDICVGQHFEDEPPSKRKMIKCKELIHDGSGGISSVAMPFGSSEKVLDQSRQDTTVSKLCSHRSSVETRSQILMSVFDFKALLADSDSEDSSSSSSSEDSDCLVGSGFLTKSTANSGRKRWESEADMITELMKDDELCMKAVCALHAQENSLGKLLGSPAASQIRGFNKSEVIRGTILAKFLVDGDPQRRLKKSVEELAIYDKKGLDDCRRIAIAHSSKLLEMSRQDYFFFN